MENLENEIKEVIQRIGTESTSDRLTLCEIYLQFRINENRATQDPNLAFWSEFCEYVEREGFVRKLTSEEIKLVSRYDSFKHQGKYGRKLEAIARSLISH